MKKLSVVIAAYDEEGNAEQLMRRLHAALGGMTGWEWEIVFVVEGRDRTREILERLAAEMGGAVRILYAERPSGLGNAFRRGFAAIAPDADLVVTLDADLNHQPEEIPRLVAALDERGADLLVGSRFVRGSSVEGTPAWKRLLSGVMNSLMRYLYGVRVLDKTSGFRVYRAELLRSVSFENDRFAFLPELLIRAHQAGYRIAEEPIRFVFRKEGDSKLEFWPTSFSYLALLRTRFDRWSMVAIGVVGVGMTVRALAAFPLHKYPGDADAVLTGLCANKVLRGETPVFFAPTRIGSLECHLAAPLVAVFGPTRLALALLVLLLGLLTLVVVHRLARTLFDRRIACLTLLFFAIPPPAVLFWTYMPNGYPLTLLLCALALWIAALVAKDGITPAAAGAFGLVCGLGFWHSFLTLGCTVPATLWLGWLRGRQLLRRPQVVLVAGALALLGASPWIAYSLRYDFAPVRGNFASRPAADTGSALDNARYLATYSLPELVASPYPEGEVVPADRLSRVLQPVVLAIHGAAAIGFFFVPAVARRRWPASWALLGAVTVTVLGLNVFSGAGELRGLTVRYVLPLAIVVAPVLALAVVALGAWRRWVSVLVVAVVVAFDLAAYHLPGDPRRVELARWAADDVRLGRLIRERRVTLVLGSFWMVYPLTFLSGERVTGVPCERLADIYGHRERVVRQGVPSRWALVTAHRARTQLVSWAATAGLEGEVEDVGESYLLLVPRNLPPRPGADWLDRALSACAGYPPLGP